MEHLETLQTWLQSRAFQALLVALFLLGCAAAFLAEAYRGSSYTRQQKNAAILAFIVMFLVVASVVGRFIFK